MKYIIVGLGNFGAALAEELTAQGHEVIGIDIKMDKVDALKEKITHTISLDATDETTVSGLPIKDTDVVVVAIGEEPGTSIMVTAVFKNLKAKRLISRAINPLHEKVLHAIGVDEIVRPEAETAQRWAKKLTLKNIAESFEINSEYSIIEVEVPDEYVGKRVKELDFQSKYNTLLLTTIKMKEMSSIIGGKRNISKVQGVASADLLLEEKDILVVYGANHDLEKFLKRSL
ncbi:trk system potassium uptake protein TrkA [Balneicella halophila]|uniref:Trk system potassium uptake protein TrkA n=1 Tax=Balneicella halophila TaxID=1537566 RepID=A0A7L4US06_BALHA|nr:TrkA family potassium uptake protein [Balneicella halophila]PVX52543.1 trk system potassium uptake protein TrkA [Balneicella halophila]